MGCFFMSVLYTIFVMNPTAQKTTVEIPLYIQSKNGVLPKTSTELLELCSLIHSFTTTRDPEELLNCAFLTVVESDKKVVYVVNLIDDSQKSIAFTRLSEWDSEATLVLIPSPVKPRKS